MQKKNHKSCMSCGSIEWKNWDGEEFREHIRKLLEHVSESDWKLGMKRSHRKTADRMARLHKVRRFLEPKRNFNGIREHKNRIDF